MYMACAWDDYAESDAAPADYIEGQSDEVAEQWRLVWEAEAACLAVGVPILPVSSGRRRSHRSFERHDRIRLGTKIWALFLKGEGKEYIIDQQFAGVIRASDDGTERDINWGGAADTMDRLSRIVSFSVGERATTSTVLVVRFRVFLCTSFGVPTTLHQGWGTSFGVGFAPF